MKRNIAVIALLIFQGAVANAAGQKNGPEIVLNKSIDVGTARPVLRAIEALRETYHVAITYEEPRYVYAGDLQDITYLHKGPTPSGAKLVAPRGHRIHFEYLEADGKPQEGMTALVGRLLKEYAAQGERYLRYERGLSPTARELNVIAVRARNEYGTMVDQTDVLGVPVSIPKEEHSITEFVNKILSQVRAESGYDVEWSTLAGKPDLWTEDFGANNISARDAFAELFGKSPVPII